MRIVHFVQYVDIQFRDYLEDLTHFMGAEHLILSRDVESMKEWELELFGGRKIPVTRCLTIFPGTLKNLGPHDLFIDYCDGEGISTEIPHSLQVKHNGPIDGTLTTALMDLSPNLIPEMSHHFIEPKLCVVVDLCDLKQDLDHIQLGYATPAEHQLHDVRRIASAMLRGAPVVANQTSLSTQAVLTGVTGIVGYTPEIVEDSIKYLIQNPDERYELGQMAREWVIENADIRVLTAQIAAYDRKNHANDRGKAHATRKRRKRPADQHDRVASACSDTQ